MRSSFILALAAVAAVALAVGCLSPQASAADATPSPSASPTYASTVPGFMPLPNERPIGENTVIHPADQLSIQVFGEQALSQNTTVLGDGTIDYPLIGKVKVAGKTPAEAATLLTNRLHEYVRHPVVNVSISQLGQIDVLVLGGDVKNPGKYQLRSDARVTDALAAAGGLANTDGAFPDARIADSAGNVTSVSLENLLQKGDAAVDRHLGEGSVVYVPGPIQFNVDISGAVDRPGELQVNEGDRLSVAIAKAGDSQNAHSDLNHIRLIRTGPDGKQTSTEINLYDALKGGDSAADVVLQKGDEVYVPEAFQQRGTAQTVGTGLLYLLTRLIP